MTVETLIIGLGSDYGDDRVGILVAEALSNRLPRCTILKLRSPLNVLDHLIGCRDLHLIDACKGGAHVGEIARDEWPISEEFERRFCGTHDFGLSATLQLAKTMGMLPPKVTLWSIEIADQPCQERFNQPLSPEVARGAKILIELISTEVTASAKEHNQYA